MGKWSGRVTVLDTRQGNTVVAEAPLGGKRWRKRKNRARDGWLWPVEHVAREYMRAEKVCWTKMGRLHRKSTRKRGDWWSVEDVSSNCVRAHVKAIRSFLRRV